MRSVEAQPPGAARHPAKNGRRPGEWFNAVLWLAPMLCFGAA